MDNFDKLSVLKLPKLPSDFRYVAQAMNSTCRFFFFNFSKNCVLSCLVDHIKEIHPCRYYKPF